MTRQGVCRHLAISGVREDPPGHRREQRQQRVALARPSHQQRRADGPRRGGVFEYSQGPHPAVCAVPFDRRRRPLLVVQGPHVDGHPWGPR